MLDRLTIERLEAAARGGPILVGLSGGGDSTALLLELAEHFGVARLRAAIVDHAIREGSAADARRALEFARGKGVDAEILRLAWPNGVASSQQSARDARYAALCNQARRLGAKAIALGHTADDQAETALMRAAAGSSWRGLAAMALIAPAPVWPEGRGVTIARPLLRAQRKDLRALLRAQGCAWIEDPANSNAAYGRVRARQRLASLAQHGFESARLVRLAERMREFVDRVDRAARELIEQTTRFDAGAINISFRTWHGEAVVRQRALSVLIAAASGEAREPPAVAVERLDARLHEPRFQGASLGGAQLSRRGDALTISRDAGALFGRSDGAPGVPPLALPANVETVWDGRCALTASTGGLTVHADAPTPRFDPPARVELRWLPAERVTHILNPVAKRD